MPQQIHMGDIGTEFRATIVEDGAAKDVSAADTITFKFRKENNSVVAKTGVFVNSGTDGLVKYISEAGFLDMKGEWDWQVYVEFPGGSKWHTDIVNFHVHPNIPNV